jgi:hypothetical protein
MELIITVADLFLLVWAIAMTILWQRAVYRRNEFMKFTVIKLRDVASGKARVVDDGEHIEIIDIKG